MEIHPTQTNSRPIIGMVGANAPRSFVFPADQKAAVRATLGRVLWVHLGQFAVMLEIHRSCTTMLFVAKFLVYLRRCLVVPVALPDANALVFLFEASHLLLSGRAPILGSGDESLHPIHVLRFGICIDAFLLPRVVHLENGMLTWLS